MRVPGILPIATFSMVLIGALACAQQVNWTPGPGRIIFATAALQVSEGYKYGSSAISPATKAVSQAVWLVKPLAGSWQLAIAASNT